MTTTDPKAMELLLELETFSTNICGPSCGAWYLSKVLESNGYIVKSTDIIDRGYGTSGINFLETTEPWNGDIITNPPYKYAADFINKSLSIITYGNKVAMFLTLQFLEGKARKNYL